MEKGVKVFYKPEGFPARIETGIVKSSGVIAGELTHMIQLDCKPEGELLAFYSDEIRSM